MNLVPLVLWLQYQALKKKVGVRSQQIVCVEGKEEVFLLLKDGGGYLFGAQLKLSQDV